MVHTICHTVYDGIPVDYTLPHHTRDTEYLTRGYSSLSLSVGVGVSVWDPGTHYISSHRSSYKYRCKDQGGV